MRKVNSFGDRAADKRLRSTHHADMSMSMNISFAFFTAFVCAIKNSEVLVLQIRCAFYGHCAAYIIICFFNFIVAEAERLKQAPFEIEILFRSEPQSLQAF